MHTSKYHIKQINDPQFRTERAPGMTQNVISSIPELLFSTSQKKKKNSMVKEVEPSWQLQLHNKKKKKNEKKSRHLASTEMRSPRETKGVGRVRPPLAGGPRGGPEKPKRPPLPLPFSCFQIS